MANSIFFFIVKKASFQQYILYIIEKLYHAIRQYTTYCDIIGCLLCLESPLVYMTLYVPTIDITSSKQILMSYANRTHSLT